MARKSNADLLTAYRSKIVQSKKWRKEEEYDDLWSRLIDLYRGKHYKVSQNSEDRLLINVAFATINVILPGVTVNYPKITVNARRPEDADRAVVTEEIVNYWWRHFECQPEFRRATKDMVIAGHGWLKTGYRFVEKEKENYDNSDELAALTPESITESDLIITEDRPFVERVSPFDVFVDPDATGMSDIKWIAQRIRRPLEEVKKDRRYNTTARVEAAPSHYSKWGTEDYRPRQYMSAEDSYVEIWEYYDIDRDTISVFCDGADKFLVNPTKNPFSFGHPFVMLRNYDVPETFYPMGELEAIEPLQHELNQTRTQMMNHRKRYSRKWLFKESAFDGDGRASLESDEDNVMVSVITEEPLQNVILPMPAIINPPEFYNQSSLIAEDIKWVSGVNEYQSGTVSEIRRTATEAGIINDASNARVADKLAIVEAGIAACARRLVMLAQQYMTGEQAIRVIGMNAQQAWLNFDSEYIKGEFDFEVEGGSTAPVNESVRRQMAMQVVDAMAPFAGAGIIDMPKLANYVLQYGFGIKAAGSFILQPQMGPQPISPQGIPEPGPDGLPPQGMPPEMPPDPM